MKIRNFAAAQAALRPFYDTSRTPYTLDVMRRLTAYLGNPQNKLRVVHVAGTSGKTSTAYYAAALLRASGKVVGLTVSPHVDQISERLQINGQPLPEAEFCALLGEFLELVAVSGIQPSYFELLMAMAFWEFARRGVDYAVVEVGLGGLLDASNVVERPDKLCIITDIGLDHTEILGDTLAKIAAQKAGIITPHNQVFMYRQAEEVMASVQSNVQEQAATLTVLDSEDYRTLPELPLFQQRNLGLAARAIDFVLQRDDGQPLTDTAVQTAACIVVPARLERRRHGNKVIIMDGAHNQQKLTALLSSIEHLYPEQPIAAMAGFVQGPDRRWQGGTDVLLEHVNRLICTGFAAELDMPKRSVDPALIADYCQKQHFSNVSVVPDAPQAYQELLQAPEPVLLVTGSFYLLNSVRPLIVELS